MEAPVAIKVPLMKSLLVILLISFLLIRKRMYVQLK